MSRVAYVNGRYLPHASAGVHIEDRGYQFADGVYEVCEVRAGKLIDATRHLARLARSLNELRIDEPLSEAALRVVLREVVGRNRVENGIVYMQVTRGVAPRDHAFPTKPVRPALVVTAKNTQVQKAEANAEKGVSVVTVPETRWARPDIKSVGLLANVLARQAARDQGAYEAWFVDADGHVTEGASTNAWIVTGNGDFVTRHADHAILKGITRTTLIDLLNREGLKLIERPFTPQEAKEAREVFITSATSIVLPVVSVDGAPIGNGHPGSLATKLRAAFHEIAEIS